MKAFNLTWSVLFVVFAALQFNDPDPLFWILIYASVALLCLLAALGRVYPTLYLIAMALFAGYAVYKFVEPNGLLDWIRVHQAENIAGTMKATQPWIEEAREFFGLVLLIIVLAVNYFTARNRKRLHKK